MYQICLKASCMLVTCRQNKSPHRYARETFRLFERRRIASQLSWISQTAWFKIYEKPKSIGHLSLSPNCCRRELVSQPPHPSPSTASLLLHDSNHFEHLFKLHRPLLRLAKAIEVINQHLRIRSPTLRDKVIPDQDQEILTFRFSVTTARRVSCRA